MTDPLNIIFDNFGIHVFLLGYMIEFSCLYIPQKALFPMYFVAMKNI